MSVTFAVAVAHDDAPEVNMANGNAATILNLLGLDTDGYGEHPAEDFLGRVLLALALLGDEHGRPTAQDGRWWDGGCTPGYLAGRLVELHHIASWAIQNQTFVVWS